jgi:outer membrane protein assembly factor BamB
MRRSIVVLLAATVVVARPTAVGPNEWGSGSQGEANRPLVAVRPGAKGDISLESDQASNEFVVWKQPRFSGYTRRRSCITDASTR